MQKSQCRNRVPIRTNPFYNKFPKLTLRIVSEVIKCFQRELHQALQVLKQMGPHSIAKKKQTVVDRLKEIEFKKKGENIVMSHMGQELAVYFGKWKFDYGRDSSSRSFPN